MSIDKAEAVKVALITLVGLLILAVVAIGLGALPTRFESETGTVPADAPR